MSDKWSEFTTEDLEKRRRDLQSIIDAEPDSRENSRRERRLAEIDAALEARKQSR